MNKELKLSLVVVFLALLMFGAFITGIEKFIKYTNNKTNEAACIEYGVKSNRTVFYTQYGECYEKVGYKINKI